MYHYKNRGGPPSLIGKNGRGPAPEDCFAEKAGHWIYLLIFVAIVVLIVSARTTLQHATLRRKKNHPALVANPVAFDPCPYCRGLLDFLGRCNLPKCPIYSPNWGHKTAAAAPRKAELKSVLIKELAIEVNVVPRFNGVGVRSVYVGGWGDKGGLKARDMIVNFNGEKVKNIRQFQGLVAKAAPEMPVKVEFLRAGEMRDANVMVGEGEMEGAVKPVHWGYSPWRPR